MWVNYNETLCTLVHCTESAFQSTFSVFVFNFS